MCSPRPGAQSHPPAVAPVDPSPGSQVLPATPLRGLSHLLIETAGRTAFFVFLPLLWAAPLRTQAGGGRVALAAALRQRNPTSSPAAASSFLRIQRAGLPCFGRPFAPGRGSEGLTFQGGERIGTLGQPSWSSALSGFQRRARGLGDRWKAGDQWGRPVLRSPYLLGGGGVA